MEVHLNGKVVVITGGTGLIGEGLVKRFVNEGCKVYFTYLKSKEKANVLEKTLKEEGKNIKGICVDGVDLKAVENFIKVVINDEKKIDVLINNAGYIPRELFSNTTIETWDRAMEVNVKSAYNYCKTVLKHMVNKKNGVIINVSSLSADRPSIGQAAYAASKGAIESLSKVLAIENGRKNIRINTIAPALVLEEAFHRNIREEKLKEILSKTPLHRFASVEDVVNTVVFLVSDEAKYLTGIQIPITGGRHLI